MADPSLNLQTVVANLQNLVQAVNGLITVVQTQFGQANVYKVATLPNAAQPARAFVSDSTVAAASHFGSAVVGGGSNYVPVYYDNTSWKIG